MHYDFVRSTTSSNVDTRKESEFEVEFYKREVECGVYFGWVRGMWPSHNEIRSD